MALKQGIYQLGRIILCLALTFQGLYVMGYLPNKALLGTMTRNLKTFQSFSGTYHPYLTSAEKNIDLVAKGIGILIALSALNILATSKFIIKLNIVGLLALTFFIGFPYQALAGKSDWFDPADKSLFHLYANLAIIGGLLYYHECTPDSDHDHSHGHVHKHQHQHQHGPNCQH